MSATADMPTMAALMEEVRGMRAMLTQLAVPGALTRPLTAEELIARWHVEADTPALQLKYLARKCDAWGLRAMEGTRGWAATYRLADVVHAEAVAVHEAKRKGGSK